MYDIKSYQELKEYNDHLKSLGLPAVGITKVQASSDEIYLDNSSSPVSLYESLYDYTNLQSFYFTNLKSLARLNFPYYYTILNPVDAAAQLRDQLSSFILYGVANKINAGGMELTLSGDKWVLLSCSMNQKVIYIPAFVDIIDNSAFMKKSELEKIVILGETVSVGDNSFAVCYNLREFVCENGINAIGTASFKDCLSLKSIKLGNTLTEITEGAFQGCSSLNNIIIPEGVTEIKEYAFEGCRKLKDIQFPSTLESIEGHAFTGCTNLSEIDLSATKVTKFAPFVFSRVNFKKIIFPDDIGSTEFEIGANALAISDKTTKREFENAPRYMSLDVTYSTSRYSRNRDVRHYDMKVDSVRFCSDANIAKVKLRPQRRQRDV